jgi:galactofuranosylgalactofuranosylrhamnosyl-N-acetylglucosaminyl-diphospho-decaprenol beta-1,5/1,6-galactofuranosyltransferase
MTWQTIHRVVFPSDKDTEVMALYLDADTWAEVDEQPVRLTDRAHVNDVVGRESFRVRPGRRVSFATYFNAFPASYWQRWTDVDSVKLTVRTSGPGTVLIYRSNARGAQQRIDSRTVSGEAQLVDIVLPITNFGDGGWYWFDLVAGDKELILDGASWATDRQQITPGKASVAITTFNRPDYCLEVIRALNSEEQLSTDLDRVFVIDQGTDKVSEQPDYEAVAAGYGDRLAVIEQANLGGSGGFSRGMIEALDRPESEYVLLLDDDVVLEPEGVLRAVQFARYCRTPTIVGGHMFDMHDRSVLHAFAEVVDLSIFMWGAASKELAEHDFRNANLRQSPVLHQRADSDYNGWWMSMIPLSIVREIGLAIPVFIKWDDSEYSLRARDHGYPTVSLPGAAVWHVSWQDKDDTTDWQAYFHARNRWIAALLHSPMKRGGRYVRESLVLDLKHLLQMQYYPAQLRHNALNDVLSGPAGLHASMATKLAEARAIAADYPEMTVIRDVATMPLPIQNKPDYSDAPQKGPKGRRLYTWLLSNVARHTLKKPSPSLVGERPQVDLTNDEARWWRVSYFDSALVSTADGTGKTHFRRNSREFRRRLRQSILLHRKLRSNWPRLAEEYRAALQQLTSREEWERTLGRH